MKDRDEVGWLHQGSPELVETVGRLDSTSGAGTVPLLNCNSWVPPVAPQGWRISSKLGMLSSIRI